MSVLDIVSILTRILLIKDRHSDLQLEMRSLRYNLRKLYQRTLARITTINAENEASIKRYEAVTEAAILSIRDEGSTRIEHLRSQHHREHDHSISLRKLSCNYAIEMHELKQSGIKEQSNSQVALKKASHSLEAENVRDEGR
ncbi:hypothetical protein BDZ45DRAFT_747302 [Acephala macrosclerotiorum]|nr:hypothetical protein BDZ45DRAFT_747302 [Acephala macrosclerotiorum]